MRDCRQDSGCWAWATRSSRSARDPTSRAPCGAPTVETWRKFAVAALSAGVDPLHDEKYDIKALARAYDDGAVSGMADIDYKDRTDAQKIAWNAWSNSRNWWEALVRVSWDPESSEPAAKKPRVV